MAEILLYNPHAGDILKSEFIAHIGINATKLARAIDTAPKNLYAMINGTTPVDDALDAKLCAYFKISSGYFLRLQASYDALEVKRNRVASHRKNTQVSAQGIARVGAPLKQQISVT